MSIQLYDYINTFYKKFNGIILITNNKKKKKDKNIFKLKEGYVNFFVKFEENKIECNFCNNPKICSLRKCRHVYFILINHFKLDIYNLTLLWRNDNWKQFLNEGKLFDDFSEEECGVCLDEIEKNNKIDFKNIYQCLDCGNFSHQKCLKRLKEDHCLYCYKSNKPSLPF